MINNKHAIVKWNSRNKKYYTDKGYIFTHMGDEFEVSVDDLTKGSSAIVELICDYCGKEFTQAWQTRILISRRTRINKDCCRECCEIKSKEAVCQQYGSYVQMYESCNDKRKTTNTERYGCENVFSSEEIKSRIVNTNLKKYGVKCSQQDKAVRERTKQTCKEKYGVENYIEVFKGKFIKENSPCWKGGPEYSRVERATYEYNTWRTDVFKRDNYTCQKCKSRSKSGSNLIINAHHIKNWKDNPDSRYDPRNGITLCEDCHKSFHSIYGKSNNNEKQLEEFLSDEKIC